MTYPGNEPADYPTRADLPPAQPGPMPNQPLSDQPAPTAPIPDNQVPGDRIPGDQVLSDQVPGNQVPGNQESSRTKPAPGFTESGHVKNTRTSGIWIGLIVTAIFLILLIDFIAQNSRKVSIHFFGWHGQFSLALTILFSAVVGVVLVAIPGTVRILQLRRALYKNGPGRKNARGRDGRR